MKKIYCVKFYKYKIFWNPKISYIFIVDKALVPSTICDTCDSKDEKRIKSE